MTTSNVNALSVGSRGFVVKGFTGELYNGHKIIDMSEGKATHNPTPLWRTKLGAIPKVLTGDRGADEKSNLTIDPITGAMGLVKFIPGTKKAYFEKISIAEAVKIESEKHNNFFSMVQKDAPAVNTIRVDVNGHTFDNAYSREIFKAFVERASASGYKILFQYADGTVSNSHNQIQDRIFDEKTSKDVSVNKLINGWTKILNWLDKDASAKVRENFYGFELINEPINYGKSPEGVKKYVSDITKIYKLFLDKNGNYRYDDKKILIGAMGASGDFKPLAKEIFGTKTAIDVIRKLIGEDLVWSVHSYPQWNKGDSGFARFNDFLKRIKHIGNDDIILTETNVLSVEKPNKSLVTSMIDYGALDHKPGGGVYNPKIGEQKNENFIALNKLTDYITRSDHYTWARTFEYLEEKGIGAAWWGATEGLANRLFTDNRQGEVYVNHNALAFATNLWVSSEKKAAYAGDKYKAFGGGNYAFGYQGDDKISAFDKANVLDPNRILKLYGGLGNDTLIAGNKQDFLFGNVGDDFLYGGNEDDLLMGGKGNDRLFGGQGNDFMEGGHGNDKLYGGNGNDHLIVGDGYDQLTGGAGRDTFVFEKIDNKNIKHHTIIHDFEVGIDKISVEHLGISSIRQISNLKYAKGVLKFTYDDGAATAEIYIENTGKMAGLAGNFSSLFDFI